MQGNFTVRLAVYVIGLCLVSAFTAFLVMASLIGEFAGYNLCVMFLVAMLGASHASACALHASVLRRVHAKPLRREALAHGLEISSPTLVVVPLLLTESSVVSTIIKKQSERFAMNSEADAEYCLLVDFNDSQIQESRYERKLLEAMAAETLLLRRRYGKFMLLYRRRTYNANEQSWQGWERKRGKLEQLNDLILNGDSARCGLDVLVGEIEDLRRIRFVVVLDADTGLPCQSLSAMISAMADVLRPPAANAISPAIIQPRMLQVADGPIITHYQWLYRCNDLASEYGQTRQDFYQDVFGAGSFYGKGIYDVKTFTARLSGKLPPQQVLSHDLIEGEYAHCRSVSEIVLTEQCPTSFMAEMRRRHRWVRGDWQLAPWLLPSVRNASSIRERNNLSAFSRWKIVDNIRRSLTSVALVSMIVGTWFLSPHLFLSGTLLVLLSAPIELAELVSYEYRIIRARRDLSRFSAGERHRYFLRAMFRLVFLLHESVVSVSAIGTSAYRMFVSRRHLLEWSPSSSVPTSSDGSIAVSLRLMIASELIACTLTVALSAVRPFALLFAFPWLVAWLLAPVAAAWSARTRFFQSQEDSACDDAAIST